MTRYEKAVDAARLFNNGEARKWPFFFHHKEAVCAFCDALLTRHTIGGNAPLHGAYKGHCSSCDKTTWYDCAEGTVEMLDLTTGYLTRWGPRKG
jgi:hypothetical protein